ncbi:hypothetical protein ACN28E_03460 [Archangium lansingense]|uniref:hypothetical protein n=1 Tax=Archangium lansingense TaxID=2995310 RepID=UPI003B796FD0
MAETGEPSNKATKGNLAQTKKCFLEKLTLQCEHKDEETPANISYGASNLVFEVVTDMQSDTVKMEAKLKAPCGKHSKWTGGGKSRTGRFFSLDATAPVVKAALVNVYRDHDVSLETCGGTYPVVVRAYPATELTIEYTFKEAKGGAMTPRSRQVRRQADRKLAKREKKAKREGKTVQVNWARTLDNVRNTIDNFRRRYDLDLNFEYLKGTAAITAAWVEYQQGKVFYNYELAVGFAPLIGITGKVPIGTAILKFIPKWFRDYVGDVSVYVWFEGSIALQLSAARTEPKKPEVALKLKGEIKGGLGAELRIGRKKGSNLVSVQVKGGTGVAVEGKANAVPEPKVTIQAELLGLTVSISVELLGGRFKFEDSVRIFDRYQLFNKEFKFDQEEQAPAPRTKQATIRAG